MPSPIFRAPFASRSILRGRRGTALRSAILGVVLVTGLVACAADPLQVIDPAGTCAAPFAMPTNEVAWAYVVGAGLPGAFVPESGPVTATLAQTSGGTLLLPFAIVSRRAPFVCYRAWGTLTIAGAAPVEFSISGLYHFQEDAPVWILVMLDDAHAELALDGRAYTLELSVQDITADYATHTLTGTIDDPRS